jgi:tetratricopeptide (TPR) repeat protein
MQDLRGATSPTLEERFQRALKAMDDGDWAAALATLDACLALDATRSGLWFNRAWCRLRLGDAAGAQDDLRELLALTPGHAPALAMLGRLQLAEGLLQVGAATLSLAWRAAPDDAEIASDGLRAWLVVPGAEHEVLGLCQAMAARGLLAEADALAVARVLQLHPGSQDALHQLWIDLCQLPADRLQTWMFRAWAESCVVRARHAETAVAARLWLNHQPDSRDALDLLVQALAARGDYDAALPLALQRARAHPDDGDGLWDLVDVLYASMDTSARMAAAQILAHALQRDPENPLWWCLRGEINARLFLKDEAMHDFRRALALDPGSETALCGVAGGLSQQGRFDEALALLHAHGGQDARRWSGRMLNALGNILRAAGRLADSEVVLRAGLELTGNPVFAVNLAFNLLSQGRYAEGFAQFLRRREARRTARTWHRAVALGARPWSGELDAVRGRHLLLIAENGIGDTFHFARFIPGLVVQGVRVTLAAQPRTEGVLRSLHPEVTVVDERQPLPAADAVCDVHDLPGFMGADLHQPETLGQAACLSADPAVVARVDAQMRAAEAGHGQGQGRPLRVALGWRGTRNSVAERSIDLAHFAAVDWGVPITWFSLQHEEASAEDRDAARALGMVCPSWSFDEAAAAMTLMDAVVSIDTVYAHLAGALGLAPIVLLNLIVDWRWETGATSPWYPKAALIRAQTLDGWPQVMLDLAARLRGMSPKARPALPASGPADSSELSGDPVSAQLAHHWPTDHPQALAIVQALAAGRLEEAGQILCEWMGSEDDDPALWVAFQNVLPHLAHPGVLAGALRQRLASQPVSSSPTTAPTTAPTSASPAMFAAVRAYGLMCLKARRHAEGLPAMQWSAAQAPEDPWSWILLARIHHLGNEGAACLRAAQRAVVLAPSEPAARAALFLGLMSTWRYDEAWVEVHRRLAELQAAPPVDAVALAETLGCEAAIWRGRGDLAQAEAALRRALQVHPLPGLQGHLGELLALQGRYAEAREPMLGLEEPKARLGDAVGQWLQAGTRAWRGPLADIVGQHLVVEADNGAGDTFQFARFLPGMVQRGVTVTLRVSPGQLGLMRQLQDHDPRCSVQVVSIHEPLPASAARPDALVHLEPLPWALGITLETLDAWGPAHYLRADERRQRAVKDRWDLGAEDGRLKIGLAWLGQAVGGGVRRTELSTVAEIWGGAGLLPHLRLFALPIEPLTDEEAALAERLGMVVPRWSFEDEAAALTQLDLVVTVDTSHAHLAGSLGVPCWVLLNHTPDWRWGATGSTTPWYPTLRLFRQSQPGRWEEPLAALAQALRQRLGLAATG